MTQNLGKPLLAGKMRPLSLSPLLVPIISHMLLLVELAVQGWSKICTLGCVILRPGFPWSQGYSNLGSIIWIVDIPVECRAASGNQFCKQLASTQLIQSRPHF